MKMVPVLIASAFLLAGCATDLTNGGSQVQIIPAERATQPCYKFVGRVEGSSSLTGVYEHRGYKNAVNEMLNKAAKLGADAVVVSADSDSHYWATSEQVSGQAYENTCNK